jgi:hypothetical protein
MKRCLLVALSLFAVAAVAPVKKVTVERTDGTSQSFTDIAAAITDIARKPATAKVAVVTVRDVSTGKALANGSDTVNVTTSSNQRIYLDVTTEGDTVTRLDFAVNGGSTYSEKDPPWTYGLQFNPRGWLAKPGKYQVGITPFVGNGIAGESKTVLLTVAAPGITLTAVPGDIVAFSNDGTPNWQLSLAADGWVIPPVVANATELHVNALQGSDNNTGASDAPLKTIAAALARKASGQQLVISLAGGMGYYESLDNTPSGDRPAEPTIIRTDPNSSDRACIASNDATVAYWKGKSNIMLLDLQLRPKYRSDSKTKLIYGLFALNCQRVWLEGCDIALFSNGVSYQGQDTFWARDLVLRRNLITWNYQPGSEKHSQGAYIFQTNGITVRENYAIHNGWNLDKGAPATWYNHAFYFNAINENVIFENNFGDNNGSHFAQVRPGGTIAYNLAYRCPIGFSIGLVNGDGHQHPGGVIIDAHDNAVISSRDIAGAKRGMGFQIANVQSGKITRNLVALGNQKWAGEVAFSVEYGEGAFEKEQVGINNLDITGNVVSQWQNAYKVESGKAVLRNVNVSGNNWNYPSNGINLAECLPADFSARAMLQSRWHWDDALTAKRVILCLQKQFKMD